MSLTGGMTVQRRGRAPISGPERLWSALAHAAILIPGVGILIALAIRYLNKESWFIRDHARQAIGFQIFVLVLIWGGSFFVERTILGGISIEEAVAEQPNLVMLLVALWMLRYLAAGYGFLGAFRAWTGREFKYAIVGDWAEAFYKG